MTKNTPCYEIGSDESFGYAFSLAYTSHFGQKRKITGEPYICHPIRVAHILDSVLMNSKNYLEDYHCKGIEEAAIMHDLLEDTPVTVECLWKFDERIIKLVQELTNPSSKLPLESPRAIKKEMDFKHIRTISNIAKIIKLADRYDNLRDIEWTGKKYGTKYLEESDTLLEICRDSNTDLAKLLEERIKQKKETFKYRTEHTDAY